MTIRDLRPPGMSLGDIAKAMGASRSSVQRIEDSLNPTIRQIVTYARATGIDPAYISSRLMESRCGNTACTVYADCVQ